MPAVSRTTKARLHFHAQRLRPARGPQDWEDVVGEALHYRPSLVTVDVFDTVLSRSVAGDDNIERIVCDAVERSDAWNGKPGGLYEARRSARLALPGGSHHDWFESLARRGGITDVAGACETEVETELSLAYAVPGAAQGLAILRSSGVPIRFVSDMHLPAHQLERLLISIGVYEPEDSLVVSCDQGATKADGTLFDQAIVPHRPRDVVHIGNHPWSDVAMARASGCNSVFLDLMNPTTDEQADIDTGIAGGTLASEARRARTEPAGPSERTRRSALAGVGTLSRRFRPPQPDTFLTWSALARSLAGRDVRTATVWVNDVVLMSRVVGDHNIKRIIADHQGQPVDTTSSHLWTDAPGAVVALRALAESGVELTYLARPPVSSEAATDQLRQLGLLANGEQVLIAASAGRLEPTDVVICSGQSPLGQGESQVLNLDTFRPNRFERRFASSGVAGGILAGASRLARLTDGDQSAGAPRSQANQTFVETGTSVLGLAFVGFTLWCREQCRADGITNVAFSARDGHLPMRIAAALPGGYWDETNVVYLHGNRKTQSLAGAAALGIDQWMAIGTEDAQSYLYQGLHDKPLAESLRRLGLTIDDLPDHLGILSLDPTKPLDVDARPLWQETLDDPDVRALVNQRAQLELDVIGTYIDQLGLGTDRWAIVDVGWTGRMSAIVSAIVSSRSTHRPLTLHFGAANITDSVDRLLTVRRFAFDGVSRVAPIANIVSCVETFTSSGLERATGFSRCEDGTVRVDLSAVIHSVADEGRNLLWDSAVLVARSLPPTSSILAPYLDDTDALRDVSALVFTDLWLDPTPGEADAIGSLTFELDGHDLALTPVASPFTMKQVAGRQAEVRRQWRHGSIAITRFPLRPVLRFAVKASEMVRPGRLPVG